MTDTWNPAIVDWVSHQAHADSLKTSGGLAAKTIYEPESGDTLESYKGDIVNSIKGMIPQLVKMRLANSGKIPSDPFISFELPDDSLLAEYKELIIATATNAGGLEWLPYMYFCRYGKTSAAAAAPASCMTSCCPITVGAKAPY